MLISSKLPKKNDLLNKGSLSLLKLSSVSNLTEIILKGEITREEISEKGHDASFDTEVLLKVFFKYVNNFESHPQTMWKTYKQPSENLISKSAIMIRRIGEKRRRKKSKSSEEFVMFNGWS